MRKVFQCLSLVFVFLFLWSYTQKVFSKAFSPPKHLAFSAKLEIPFVKNEGQLSPQVAFYAQTFSGRVLVMKQGEIFYQLLLGQSPVWLQESFVGAKTSAISGEVQARARVSYFLGADQKRWKSNLPTYRYVSLGELYAGVQVKLHAYSKRVEKLFYVAPGADVSRIRLRVNGAKKLVVLPDGSLEAQTPKGPVRFSRPLAYQEKDGKRQYVPVSYVVRGKEYGFRLGAYDASRPLVIDPFLAGTYLGGSEYESISAFHRLIAVDEEGNVYIAGHTKSADLPATDDAYDKELFTGYYDQIDVFIAKFNADLSQLLALTYLGGWSEDIPHDMVYYKDDDEGKGYIYITGETKSPSSNADNNFPLTTGAFQVNPYCWQSDAVIKCTSPVPFVSKLSSDLSQLVASTYLSAKGGASAAYAIAVGKVKDEGWLIDGTFVYVFGRTYDKRDFPYNQPVQRKYFDETLGEYAAETFLVMLTDDLTKLQTGCLLGGDQEESTWGIELYKDDDGYVQNVYILGATQSANFPVGYFDDDEQQFTWEHFHYQEGVYQTLLNNSTEDNGSYNHYDIYLARLTHMLYFQRATFLGGSGEDGYSKGSNIHFGLEESDDGKVYVYVAGTTTSSDYPTTENAYRQEPCTTSDIDIVVSKLDGDLTELLASTYFGNSGCADYARDLWLDKTTGELNVYILGYFFQCYTSDLPVTEHAFQTQQGDPEDGYYARFDANLSQLKECSFLGGSDDDFADSLLVNSDGNVYFLLHTYSSNLPTSENAFDSTHNGGGTDAFILKLQDKSRLTVQKIGGGSGTVTSENFSGINCGDDCENLYYIYDQGQNTVVSLKATPDEGSVFVEWQGDCVPTDSDPTLAEVVMDENAKRCTAKFAIPPHINNFLIDTVKSLAPLEVTFKCEASDPDGEIAKYYWDFDGDGQIDQETTENSVTYVYRTKGDYQATCTVEDNDGAKVTSEPTTINVTDEVEPSPNIVVITDLAADPLTGVAPLTVKFSVEAQGGSGSYTYSWDFGDGETSQEQNPQHEYQQAGEYTVTVTVTDADDPTDTATGERVVKVVQEPEAYSPVAISKIAADPITGVAPLTVKFSVEAQGGSGSYTYSWDFGDGETSQEQNPQHEYQQAGEYTVTVTVTDADDPTNTTTGELVVLVVEGPETINVSLTGKSTTGEAPLKATFTATIQGGTPPYTLTWDFGDGSVELSDPTNKTEITVSHTYEQAGNYQVTLKVESARGIGFETLTVRTSLGITVSEPPSNEGAGMVETQKSGGGSGGCMLNPGAGFSLDAALLSLPLLSFLIRRRKK